MNTITKDEFVRLLSDAGVNDQQMRKLHTLFENRHPDAHDGLLRWLGVNDTERKEIRSWAKKSEG